MQLLKTLKNTFNVVFYKQKHKNFDKPDQALKNHLCRLYLGNHKYFYKSTFSPCGYNKFLLFKDWRDKVLGACDNKAVQLLNQAERPLRAKSSFVDWVCCDQVMKPLLKFKSQYHAKVCVKLIDVQYKIIEFSLNVLYFLVSITFFFKQLKCKGIFAVSPQKYIGDLHFITLNQ